MLMTKRAGMIVVGLLIAGLAIAQPPGGGGPGGGGRGGGGRGGFGGFGRGGFGGMFGGNLGVMIPFNQQLQEELKVDQEQLKKLNAAFAKVREDMQDEMGQLFSPETSAEDRAAIQKKMTEANTKALNSVLKPEQLKRLKQIETQRAGIDAYTKEDVQKALKLSDDQKDKIASIVKEYQKDLRELYPEGRGGFGRGFDPETQRKQQGLQKEAMSAIQKTLSDDQKTAFKDLTGEPFELQFGFGRGGFGPGGGGPGGFGPGGAVVSEVVVSVNPAKSCHPTFRRS